MRTFEVYTQETVTRSYIVQADTADEARQKFEAGDYERENPGETIDCEVRGVVDLTVK